MLGWCSQGCTVVQPRVRLCVVGLTHHRGHLALHPLVFMSTVRQPVLPASIKFIVRFIVDIDSLLSFPDGKERQRESKDGLKSDLGDHIHIVQVEYILMSLATVLSYPTRSMNEYESHITLICCTIMYGKFPLSNQRHILMGLMWHTRRLRVQYSTFNIHGRNATVYSFRSMFVLSYPRLMSRLIPTSLLRASHSSLLPL